MKKVMFVCASMIALAATATATFAGRKTVEEVWIRNYGTWQEASGAIGSVRGSSDSNQEIGCSLYGNKDYSVVTCHATDASGAYLTCYNRVNAGMKEAVSSISANSQIYFQTDPLDN